MNGDNVISCGGTRVGSRHVVTAAHCLEFNYRRVKPFQVTVYTDSIEKWKGIVARVARVFIHPEFSPEDGSNDIAVIRLKKRLDEKASAVLNDREIECPWE
jgi:secreted trypsin-like serine protease